MKTRANHLVNAGIPERNYKMITLWSLCLNIDALWPVSSVCVWENAWKAFFIFVAFLVPAFNGSRVCVCNGERSQFACAQQPKITSQGRSQADLPVLQHAFLLEHSPSVMTTMVIIIINLPKRLSRSSKRHLELDKRTCSLVIIKLCLFRLWSYFKLPSICNHPPSNALPIVHYANILWVECFNEAKFNWSFNVGWSIDLDYWIQICGRKTMDFLIISRNK